MPGGRRLGKRTGLPAMWLPGISERKDLFLLQDHAAAARVDKSGYIPYQSHSQDFAQDEVSGLFCLGLAIR
jgi:hypothetical protein